MKYPSVNYIGNKEKIVNWIISLIPKDASSILDVFAGGCSVSYAAKLAGMTVYTNADIFQEKRIKLYTI